MKEGESNKIAADLECPKESRTPAEFTCPRLISFDGESHGVTAAEAESGDAAL